MAKKASKKAAKLTVEAHVYKIDAQLDPLTVDLGKLYRDPGNARKHDERSIKAIMDSLRRFGQVKPILATTEGRIIAGNGTHEAAERLGWEKIAVVRSENLSASAVEAAAYGLADNRLTELSAFDDEAVREILSALKDSSAEVGDLGWSDEELTRIIGEPEGSGGPQAGGPDDEDPLGDGSGFDRKPPDEFPEYDPDSIPTEFACPKCSYEWSGRPK